MELRSQRLSDLFLSLVGAVFNLIVGIGISKRSLPFDLSKFYAPAVLDFMAFALIVTSVCCVISLSSLEPAAFFASVAPVCLY